MQCLFGAPALTPKHRGTLASASVHMLNSEIVHTLDGIQHLLSGFNSCMYQRCASICPGSEASHAWCPPESFEIFYSTWKCEFSTWKRGFSPHIHFRMFDEHGTFRGYFWGARDPERLVPETTASFACRLRRHWYLYVLSHVHRRSIIRECNRLMFAGRRRRTHTPHTHTLFSTECITNDSLEMLC